MLEHELRGLESQGQLFMRCLPYYARAGEAYRGARLGDDDIRARCERRHYPADRGIGQNTDVNHGDLRQSGPRDACLGHLHQREEALLHARATGRGDGDERYSACSAALHGTGDALAHHLTHAASDVVEIHDGNADGSSFEAAGPGDDRVV